MLLEIYSSRLVIITSWGLHAFEIGRDENPPGWLDHRGYVTIMAELYLRGSSSRVAEISVLSGC